MIILIGIGLRDKSLHLVLLSILPIDVTSDTCLFSLETRNHKNEIIIRCLVVIREPGHAVITKIGGNHLNP